MLRKSAIVGWTIVLAALVQPIVADEQPLATGELIVLGARLEVAPAQMTVPVGVPSRVQTVYCMGQVEPHPELIVKASLRGPGLPDPVLLTTRPGHSLILQAFKQSGTYTLADIRLVLDDRMHVPAQPDHVTIEVIEHEEERSDREKSRDPASSD